MRIRMMIMVFDCQYLLVMVPINPVGYFAVRSMGVVSGRDQIRRTKQEGSGIWT